MADFWNIIVQSNTFNFAILVILLAIVFAKIDLPGIIEKIKNEVASSIENAKKERLNAEEELKSAEEKAGKTDSEVKLQLQNAENNAKNLADNILKNTDENIKRIEDNIKKVILAEERNLSTKLTQETLNKAVDLAKQNILSKLDADMHQKLLDDSINEIDKVNL